MSAPLREAARALWQLRQRAGVDALRRALDQLPTADLASLLSCWQLHALPAQLRPRVEKAIWLILAGRGFGKTRAGSEYTLDVCEDLAPFDGALISKSITDLRRDMLEGPSGLTACGRRRGIRVDYIANKALVLVHTARGVVRLHVMSAEQAEFGRGPNLSFFWADEVAAWPAAAFELFRSSFLPSVRIPFADGSDTRGVITTSPKPNAITRWLVTSPEMSPHVEITRGTSYENKHIRLSPAALALEGTTMGMQELHGILLQSDALITAELINLHRVLVLPQDGFARGVVAIDPGIRKRENADATGIVVAAADHRYPAHAYVLEDLTANGLSFRGWAVRAVEACLRWGFRTIVTETNQGGDAVTDAVRTACEEIGGAALGIEVVDVWADTSKRARAETVVPLYETGRVHHLNHLEKLEREWCTWAEGAASPNRMDACVYAVSHLLLDGDAVGPLWTPGGDGEGVDPELGLY